MLSRDDIETRMRKNDDHNVVTIEGNGQWW